MVARNNTNKYKQRYPAEPCCAQAFASACIDVGASQLPTIIACLHC